MLHGQIQRRRLLLRRVLSLHGHEGGSARRLLLDVADLLRGHCGRLFMNDGRLAFLGERLGVPHLQGPVTRVGLRLFLQKDGLLALVGLRGAQHLLETLAQLLLRGRLHRHVVHVLGLGLAIVDPLLSQLASDLRA